jgi:hypothetical protein
MAHGAIASERGEDGQIMRTRWIRAMLATLLLGLGSAHPIGLGGTPALAQELAPQPPPTPQVESPGPPPSPNAVWIAGHWLWRGGRYDWVAGRWENAPPGASYIPGRHKQTGQGWVWEPGRWRKP